MSLLHDLVNVLHNIAHSSAPAKGGGKGPVSQAGASNNRPGQGLGQPNYPNDPGFPLQGQGARPDIGYDPRPNPAPYTSNNMALVEALVRRPFYTPLQGPDYYHLQNPVFTSDVGGDHPMFQGQPYPTGSENFIKPIQGPRIRF